MNEVSLHLLYEKGIISYLDIHFARFMTELVGWDDPDLLLAAALVSSYTGQGNVCLDLTSVAGKSLLKEEYEQKNVFCPELTEWRKKLEKCAVAGTPGEYKPLILDNQSRLYLYRYWEYQEEITRFIVGRVNDENQYMNIPVLKQGLERLFPPNKTREVDWQNIAVFTALLKKFCVISGGPGTGKTATAAKIIALILEQAHTEKVRIALAAPTGKAASRLQEAIKVAKEKLDCSDSIKKAIPCEASTIHRMLGSIQGSPYFRYNAQSKLPADIVIIDESSMVDLALMSKLVQAIPDKARLILLGDKGQLASVEAGATFGDICDSQNAHGFSKHFCKEVKKVTGYDIETKPDNELARGICDCIIQLQKSYRFGSESGIGAVSRAVNEGNAELSATILKDDKFSDIRWQDLPRPYELERCIKDAVINGFQEYLKTDDPWQAFDLFERFRILCALREGPWGVSALNLLVERILKEAKLIEPDKLWYSGRPLLITRNDYHLRLFNGDVGIVLADSKNDLLAYFPAADGTLRKLHPLRLPEHETVYAMTVHKSQGSEFDRVLMLLPDRDYPIMTRELIYTGITRARKEVEIWGVESVFCNAVLRRIERTSGLRDALWGG